VEWVRDNIANFGGDPHNVTNILENPGGGYKVSILMVMPAAAGFIPPCDCGKRAGMADDAKGNSDQAARKLLKELGITAANINKL